MKKFTKHLFTLVLMSSCSCIFAQQNILATRTIKKEHSHESQSITKYEAIERDPCQVLMGVFSTSCGCDIGVKVVGVLANTPADKAGIKAGDIITSIDGISVFSATDLRFERDKHEQGEEFVITYIRNNEAKDVVARFKSCETEAVFSLPIDYSLAVTDLKVFPNPTYGKLTIQFTTDAVPTVVNITDITGKLIFVDERPDFEGFYQKEINIGNDAAPGMMNIVIQQGNKAIAEKAILLPRA